MWIYHSEIHGIGAENKFCCFCMLHVDLVNFDSNNCNIMNIYMNK